MLVHTITYCVEMLHLLSQQIKQFGFVVSARFNGFNFFICRKEIMYIFHYWTYNLSVQYIYIVHP